ncbi:hypothetical protein N5079_12165 [Planotetraspora sp. A-T 1434]|uniref:hypothetical protein n=1 Tax=Planotetraspora sp. A-T 1434 TaxID=2979219 RepID=UPI0021BDFD8A|nr:hypothetical protein [Planotetraspora sp. A-T 1434]MCT9930974.1 hypothetical protein [Planotetraspora sp. A-T 1434]
MLIALAHLLPAAPRLWLFTPDRYAKRWVRTRRIGLADRLLIYPCEARAVTGR